MTSKGKKLSAVTAHLTPDSKQKLEGIAEEQGFDSASAYVRHLIDADIEEKRIQFERLASIFSDSEETESSQRSVTQFLREIENQAVH